VATHAGSIHQGYLIHAKARVDIPSISRVTLAPQVLHLRVKALVHLNVYPLVVINYDTTGQIGFAYVHRDGRVTHVKLNQLFIFVDLGGVEWDGKV
jgi:hypothetical protein